MSFHVLMSRYPRSFCRKSLWREAKGILPSSPFISGHLHRKSLVLTPPTWPGRDPSRCHCGRIRESPGRRSFATELLCCAPCACAMKSGTAGREIQRIRARGRGGLIISAWMKKKNGLRSTFWPMRYGIMSSSSACRMSNGQVSTFKLKIDDHR